MPNYRRALIQGGSYFFTVVTHKRKPLFSDDSARLFLRDAISNVRINYPFEIDALCLLPDHLHTIWTLPDGDVNYSKRWRAIKGNFSRGYRKQTSRKIAPTISRQNRGEVTFWQRRFWEHLIRDERDYRRHFDYIHFNPVKHGYTESVSDWPWSTFHRYVQKGIYPIDWGGVAEEKIDLESVGE
ncbi:MAG: transposase [Candidatus Thiodiazotropha taylori]|nr:transposase [Candidatus Thiodiazotropha taylori]MCG7910241.1 transposase [Candidatus Thiodiazotropha taylori]